jgi:hypothetical protein
MWYFRVSKSALFLCPDTKRPNIYPMDMFNKALSVKLIINSGHAKSCFLREPHARECACPTHGNARVSRTGIVKATKTVSLRNINYQEKIKKQ